MPIRRSAPASSRQTSSACSGTAPEKRAVTTSPVPRSMETSPGSITIDSVNRERAADDDSVGSGVATANIAKIAANAAVATSPERRLRKS